MATKKNFADIQTGRLYGNIEQANSKKGQQGKASPEEAHDRAEALRTQGRKGCKLTRINMGFSPSNHQFIKVMAKATGQTMTEFTNFVIDAYQREHPEIMEQAAAFLDVVNSGKFYNDNKE